MECECSQTSDFDVLEVKPGFTTQNGSGGDNRQCAANTCNQSYSEHAIKSLDWTAVGVFGRFLKSSI